MEFTSLNAFHSLMLYLRLPKECVARSDENMLRVTRTFVVETVDTIHRAAFMISSQ